MSSPHDHKINFKYINKNIQNNTLFPVFVLFLKYDYNHYLEESF